MVIKVSFDRNLEQEFRAAAMKKYGYSRGAIKQASEEAITRWIKEEYHTLPHTSRDPLKSLYGAMKHLRGKYTSVELQHEAMKLWAKKR